MARLGGSESSRGEVISIDEHLARIRAVTSDDVHRVIRRVLEAPRASVVVGPLDGASPDAP
jgi:predicted Zn-dependent peptidase